MDNIGEWGVCDKYKQPYVAFDEQLWEPVCLKAITMDPRHKGHNFIDLDKAAKMLRSEVDKHVQTSGKLRAENSESVLLDIRQAQVTASEHKNRLFKQADQLFSQLITALKARKAAFIAEIETLFGAEEGALAKHESEWANRQQICEDMLGLSADPEADVELVNQARAIKDGLAKLALPLQFHNVKLANSFQETARLEGGIELSHARLLQLLGNYLSISEYKNIQYRA